MKILVAEDDADNQALIVRQLARNKHHVILAENGKEACDLAKEERPDIILMDLSMPIMSGYTASSVIKSSPETADIAIIAISAFGGAENIERAMNAGCSAYEDKPIRFDSLMNKIKVFAKKTDKTH
ncbi:MAG: response regulator [Oligoflexales bacterium]